MSLNASLGQYFTPSFSLLSRPLGFRESCFLGFFPQACDWGIITQGGLGVHTLITHLIRRHCAELITCSLTFLHNSQIMTDVMWKSLTRSAANEEMKPHCRVPKILHKIVGSFFFFFFVVVFIKQSPTSDAFFVRSASFCSRIRLWFCLTASTTSRIGHCPHGPALKNDGHCLSSTISCLDILMWLCLWWRKMRDR